ncbi:hypothetical protein ACJX0J_014655 [Zea mays]
MINGSDLLFSFPIGDLLLWKDYADVSAGVLLPVVSFNLFLFTSVNLFCIIFMFGTFAVIIWMPLLIGLQEYTGVKKMLSPKILDVWLLTVIALLESLHPPLKKEFCDNLLRNVALRDSQRIMQIPQMFAANNFNH